MTPVVIGAAYGDEGKGATVNTLASLDSIIVRFNGGAQAGHTVIHDGHRRVFSHFGSGTLKGASTHLSRFFVCHPIAFLAEWYDMARHGITPRVTVSPDCPVTTIFDVLLNRTIENQRGANRHGSVGIGFGETLERMQRFPTTVSDLNNGNMANWLETIRDQWVPQRCKQLGTELDRLPTWFNDPATIRRQELDFAAFLSHIQIRNDEDAVKNLDCAIFEGAQGLLLDQDYGKYPYVTRSNTGLRNVRQLVGNAPLGVRYVTRAYTTRHGAGPLPFELPHQPYPGIRDDTNTTGEFQGSLRFSYLNLDDIGQAVRTDCSRYLGSQSRVRTIVTCLDQLGDTCYVIRNGTTAPCMTRDLSQVVSEVLISANQPPFYARKSYESDRLNHQMQAWSDDEPSSRVGPGRDQWAQGPLLPAHQ